MMLFRPFDALFFALERLWQHRILVLWALIGLSAAATLALSLSLYVDSVNTDLLSSRLNTPPYAFRFRYVGSWEGNITPADVRSADAAVQNGFVEPVGLSTLNTVSFVRGGTWSLRRDTASLGAFGLGVLTGAEDQMQIILGDWSAETLAALPPDTLPVMLAESALYTLGINVGDTLSAQRPGGQPVNVQVVALWRPINKDDPSWIFPTTFFDTLMLTQPDYLWQSVEGIEKPIEEVAWYVNFDGQNVKTADIAHIVNTTISGQRTITQVLPGVRLDASPMDGLNAFNKEVTALTQQLVIMVLPVAGMVLYFVTLVAGMLVGRQQQEDALLRSRGMNRWAVLRNHALMWLILALVAYAVGLVAAPFVVNLVSRTTSFLRFEGEGSALTLDYTQRTLFAGAATSLIAASSGLFLAWRSSGVTITGHRQAAARAGQAWWQRFYLDFMLLLPAVYVLFTLSQRGGLVTDAENPFADPLTFMGPTLFSLGLTLVFLRLLPFLLRLAARFIAYSRSVALLMALRELTRSTGRYRGALLMMCLTLSLTGFMASMASTLDRSLKDSVDYKVGADSVLVMASDAQTETGFADGAQTQTVTGFNTLPADDLFTISGVANVSRVGRYTARLLVPGQRLDGIALGIDRAAIAAVTRARLDYADESYAELFNKLAGNRTGIILNSKTAQSYNLLVGQELKFQIFALNTWYETSAPIVGVVDYFPTLDPHAGFFMLTNLDPLFELVGTPLPYNFWLSLYADADADTVRAAVRALGYPVLEWKDPQQDLETAQAAPARRGVFGFLSVGFLAAIALTLIIAIIQSAASFQAQSAQLGSLRAMGLGGWSVGAFLIFSQGLAALSGILGGTAIGFGTTLLYLPLLDFSGGLPPYLVRVAWADILLVYAVFAAILFTVILSTSMLLGRQQLSTIVKLGDA